MKYYFPSILQNMFFGKEKVSCIYHTVNSGENAIRLLLRSLTLPPNAKVALPLFVCDSLKNAVIKENLTPFYLDIKDNGTYWADYTSALNSNEIRTIILVHLYGFIHPDTNVIMTQSKLKNIPLIHDAAQSFGINENLLNYSNGIIYSFGPGKSSTAAGGAIVKNLSENFYQKNCKQTNSILKTLKAKSFLKSRIYNYRFSITDKITSKILGKIQQKDNITGMTNFQIQAASYAMQLADKLSSVRNINYQLLKSSIKSNKCLTINFDEADGQYFKIVFKVKKEETKFKHYLEQNKVPYFCLTDNLVVDKELLSTYPIFFKNASAFIEISTEASIPKKEMERVAFIIEKYAVH